MYSVQSQGAADRSGGTGNVGECPRWVLPVMIAAYTACFNITSKLLWLIV